MPPCPSSWLPPSFTSTCYAAARLFGLPRGLCVLTLPISCSAVRDWASYNSNMATSPSLFRVLLVPGALNPCALLCSPRCQPVALSSLSHHACQPESISQVCPAQLTRKAMQSGPRLKSPLTANWLCDNGQDTHPLRLLVSFFVK